MKALKVAFEAGNPDVTMNLTTGRSQELVERILKEVAVTSLRPPPRRSSIRTS